MRVVTKCSTKKQAGLCMYDEGWGKKTINDRLYLFDLILFHVLKYRQVRGPTLQYELSGWDRR